MITDKIIFTSGEYRILECFDEVIDMDDLCGDLFCPKANPDIPEEQLKREFHEFERKAYNDGVFGYVLEKWNPEVGIGWENINSCWGFVGRHDTENHGIVEEFKDYIRIRS